jgi:hypothetical protein
MRPETSSGNQPVSFPVAVASSAGRGDGMTLYRWPAVAVPLTRVCFNLGAELPHATASDGTISSVDRHDPAQLCLLHRPDTQMRRGRPR